MTPRKKDGAADSGAYVLNALGATERADFEARLTESDDLRAEVTELTDTAVVLGLAVDPIDPPAALKANIMARLATTPQLPREVTAQEAPAAAETAAAPQADPALPAVFSVPATASTAPSATDRKVAARWYRRPAVLLTAVAAVVALVFGGGALANVLGTVGFTTQQANQLAAITGAKDAQTAVAKISSGGTAKLVWSTSLGKSALIVDGLAKLPSDKTYELWYIDAKGTPTAAGLMTISSAHAWRVLDGTIQSGDTVGVTVEPRGGSTAPTTKPIVAIASA